MKVLFWVGDAKEQLRSFPGDVQDEAGLKLRKIQYGQMPEGVKPLAGLGKGLTGIHEIRVDGDKETYRVVYVAKLTKGVYVLHAFHKKSKTGIGISPVDKHVIIENYKAACEYDAS
jgi:phage-related protein